MAKTNKKQTSKKVASAAGKELNSKNSNKKTKMFAASALSQARPKKK